MEVGRDLRARDAVLDLLNTLRAKKLIREREEEELLHRRVSLSRREVLESLID